MSSLNQCNFIGNLGKDPEIRYTPEGSAVTSFSIACSESWKDKKTGQKVDKTEWVNVVAFGKLAEIMAEYLKKGSKVFVSGKFQTDKYEKDGVTKYSTKINARDMVMLGEKQSGGQQSESQQSGPSQEDAPQMSSNDFSDDIPF